jgi:hypothetical protein
MSGGNKNRGGKAPQMDCGQLPALGANRIVQNLIVHVFSRIGL